jgi:hypothetical protein
MDPATGIGIAAAIVQFVDFGSKVVARTSEYHHSAHGAAVGNAELEQISKDLVRLNEGLSKSLDDSNGSSAHVRSNEEELRMLCKNCQGVAKELLELLNRLKVNVGSSRWRSFQQAFLSV